jgi:hypothetical protein
MGWCIDGLVCWWVGVLVSWCVGVLMFWCVGELVCWCVSKLVCWCVDVLVCWWVGVLVSWCVGVLMGWCVGELVCWCVRVLVSLCVGVLMGWWVGVLMCLCLLVGVLIGCCVGELVCWWVGVLMCWYVGELVCWWVGVLVYAVFNLNTLIFVITWSSLVMAQEGQKCSRQVKIGGFCLNKVYFLLVLISVAGLLNQFNLTNQPYMHWNVKTIDIQSPTCFGTSWVPSSESSSLSLNTGQETFKLLTHILSLYDVVFIVMLIKF